MNEFYRLRLDHFMQDEEGDRRMVEEPLVIQVVIDRRTMLIPLCLNHMLDMMRDAVLRRAGGEDAPN